MLETVLLVRAGGLLGTALASALTRVVSATAREAGVALITDGTLGVAALAFAFAATALTAVGGGLGAALSARTASVHDALREGGRGGVGSRQRVRGWLVAGEVAAAMLLRSGAARRGRSYLALQDVDPGFNPAPVLTRLRPLPGVTAAAATSFLPLDGAPGIGSSFLLADRPEPVAGERPVADDRPVTPGYFGALQIPLRTGRDFTEADIADRLRVAIVNEAFVRQLSADVSPLGRRLNESLGESQEVVGVVGDVALASLDGAPRPAIYLPYAQLPVGSLTFVVRTAGDPAALGRAVEAVGRDVDSNQPGDVVRLVLRQRLVLVVSGVAAGALLAVPVSASLRSWLFGVGPGDPTTVMAVAALLVAAGALASYLPARSGTRVDPVTARRGE